MGVTKSEKFTNEQNEIAQIAKVLGHPARVAIVQQLFKMETCVCGELVDQIGLAQPTISQHLKELKEVGVIRGNVDGTKVCYCINLQKWNDIKSRMMHFLDQNMNAQNQCC